jgi:hypothetical protein
MNILVNLPLCWTYKSRFGINLLTLGYLGSYLKKAKVMLVFLQMSRDPPKHYGFLFGVSGLGKLMNIFNKVMTAPQTENLEDVQIETIIHKMSAITFKKKCSHPCHVKSSIPTWGQIKALSAKGKNVLLST